MVIYADVLVVLNLYINYFLIRTSALIMRRGITRKRCVLAALAGAVGSLVILLPPLPFWVVFLEKAALCALITFISFGKQPAADFAVSALFFLTVNFIFAGLMLALETIAAPYSMFCGNGVCTFNIPLGALIAFTIAAYCVVRLVRLFSDKRLRTSRVCPVSIFWGEKNLALRGLGDTGCEIRDIFTGKPIIVCEAEKIREIIPSEICAYLEGQLPDNTGLRLVPYKTVSSESLLPVFKAEKVLINDKPIDAYIGVSTASLGGDIDCVFNPKILSI